MNKIILDSTIKRFINTEEPEVDFELILSDEVCNQIRNSGVERRVLVSRLKKDTILNLLTKKFEQKLIMSWGYRVYCGFEYVGPNKLEAVFQLFLNEYFPGVYRYVGDFQVRIGRRCPDFININGKKEVIELFGSFYHKVEEVQQTIDYYKQYGFSCIVVWGEELINPGELINHIKYGDLYIPNYEGDTISDYEKRISYGDLLEPCVRLMANMSLMLMRATFIQEEYPIEPKKSRGRPKLLLVEKSKIDKSNLRLLLVEKRLKSKLRRMEYRFKKYGS